MDLREFLPKLKADLASVTSQQGQAWSINVSAAKPLPTVEMCCRAEKVVARSLLHAIPLLVSYPPAFLMSAQKQSRGLLCSPLGQANVMHEDVVHGPFSGCQGD
jgi:hypothetical protein